MIHERSVTTPTGYCQETGHCQESSAKRNAHTVQQGGVARYWSSIAQQVPTAQQRGKTEEQRSAHPTQHPASDCKLTTPRFSHDQSQPLLSLAQKQAEQQWPYNSTQVPFYTWRWFTLRSCSKTTADEAGSVLIWRTCASIWLAYHAWCTPAACEASSCPSGCPDVRLHYAVLTALLPPRANCLWLPTLLLLFIVSWDAQHMVRSNHSLNPSRW